MSVLLLACGLTGVPAPASAAPQIAWRPCPEDPAVECGSVGVPVDWSRPDGPGIEIAVARRKAGDPARRVGTLVFNLGGPGIGGVRETVNAAGIFSPELLERFDLVGFDPRGVPGSPPVLCPAGTSSVPDNPATAEEYDRMLARLNAYDKACRELSGPVFDHADSESTARDVEAVRAALGERTISLYTLSYGTLLGQRYAELFPHRLRALVLEGNLDHSLRRPVDFLTARARTSERTFRMFGDWCRGPGSGCSLGGQDPAELLDGLMARAARGEIHEPGVPEFVLTPEWLAARIDSHAADQSFWPPLDDYLIALRDQAASGAARAPEPTEPPESVENPYAAIFCSDFRWPIRDFGELSRIRDAVRRAAPHLRWTLTGWRDVAGCQGRDIAVRNPQRPYRFRPGTPPILLVNGRHDVATPHEFAVTVARRIPRGTLLTYEGVGHWTYDASPCARAAVDRYLLTLALPRPGATCPAVPVTAEDPPTGGENLARHPSAETSAPFRR
ncbi:alpha/beta hydrolase [Planomonospora sp. ID82291]|uniref:alpha/beta hydrolase n=1 Tax=Planomonospora sp. ID82291 TaxID=2738136 RepID=UPI0018C387E1|nr:alpha/beta hydrolase [Planomonospora sp. ID82291]MBG0817619.1 alpha/beta fold hydrolase [Planomonospora sp. ID82291]